VTASVVKAIFMVIVVDGLFAMFFAAIRYRGRTDRRVPAARIGCRRARSHHRRRVDLVVGFGEKLIMNGLDLDVYRGEILGFVGASGTGKSVLTRTILGLVPKRQGRITVFGRDMDTLSREEKRAVERRWGCCSSRARCSRR